MNKTYIASTIFLLILLLHEPVYADIVYLKSGGKLEGKVVNTTQDTYEIKVKSGKVVIKKEDVQSMEEKPVDISKIYSPIEEYRERLSKIDPKDAKAHFQLGFFCLEYSFYDEATDEFNLAKELDISFTQKVDKQLKSIEDLRAKDSYLRKKEDIKEIVEKEEQFGKEIRSQLGPMKQYSPDSTFDTEGFKMYLDTFKDEDKKTEYLRDCFLKAQKAEKEVLPETNVPTARQKLLLALDLYKSASFSKEPAVSNPAKEALKRLTKKLIEPEKDRLSVPIGRLYKEINEFLATISMDEAQSYCSGYLKMGKALEQEVDNLSINSEESKLKLGTALNCYLIVYNFTNDPQIKKEVLTSIKRCNKKL
jgi:tetratricopeptide (TPR) repeat protein